MIATKLRDQFAQTLIGEKQIRESIGEMYLKTGK
jgi:hypothetical protein